MCKLAVILSAAPIAPATICNLIAQSFVTDYFMNEENKNWQFFHSFVGFFVGFNAHISKTELINILRKYSDNCAKKKTDKYIQSIQHNRKSRCANLLSQVAKYRPCERDLFLKSFLVRCRTRTHQPPVHTLSKYFCRKKRAHSHRRTAHNKAKKLIWIIKYM